MQHELLILSFFFASFFISCYSKREQSAILDHKMELNSKDVHIAKVTGIGGIFFLSDDPVAPTHWYEDNLGLVTDEYGSVFEFSNADKPDDINYPGWSIGNESEYFNLLKKDL